LKDAFHAVNIEDFKKQSPLTGLCSANILFHS
jgi:hypothetical protein